MWIKAGVDISRLNREIRRGLQIVNTFVRGFHTELFITSTFESNHSAGSLHYSNDAFDFSRPVLNREKVKSLKERLGNDYDVVVESDHIHVEYDPKK